MISGASEEELEIANDRADLLLEIDRLNNIISKLEKNLEEAFNELQPNELVDGRQLIKNILTELKEKE